MNAPVKPSTPLLKNSASAPIVFFDQAPTYGHFNGVLAVELSAAMINPTSTGGAVTEHVAAARLRGSPAAMRSLIAAIEGALALAESKPVKLAS